MKRKNIIYGVSGMMEYQALIKVGGAKMKIPFTNGSSNEAGRTPATFSTSNAVVQLAIENSTEFKSGFIYVYHSVGTDEDVYIESEHVELQAKGERTPASSDVSEDSGAPRKGHPSVEANPVSTSTVPEAESSKSELQTEGEPRSSKEFTCNDDAKDFLETEFGAKRSSLRSRDAIVACGKSNGVDIKFID